MKRLLMVLLLLSLGTIASANPFLLLMSGGEPPTHECDRDILLEWWTDTTGWTIDSGGWEIFEGWIRGDNWLYSILRNNTQTEAEYQWGRFEIDYVNEGTGYYLMGIILRSSGSSGYYYVIGLEWNDLGEGAHNIEWQVWNGTNRVQTVKSQATTWQAGDSFGARVTGTGNDTVIDVWKNPSGTCPDDWGSPTWSWTDNPTNAADSGTYVGLFCGRDNDYIAIGDVSFGD